MALMSLPWRWRSIVREFRPDVVHAHMVAGAVIGRTLRQSAEYVLVTTVHNEFEPKSKLMGLGDRVIAVSRAGAESLVRRGVDQARLRVVVNGTLGSPRARASGVVGEERLEHPAILTVAGMFERKGIADLLAAFELVAAKLPAAHLYLAGDGPDRRKFESQAKKLAAADRIRFLGFRDKPQALMKAADLFVLPSRREPFGLVFTEAMEVGCPVIGSNVDGIPEILGRHGEHGLLVPPCDPVALAGAIERVLSSVAERRRLGEAARERARAFTVERVTQETGAVYRELLEGNHSRRLDRPKMGAAPADTAPATGGQGV
jgi:glycosyltransferase involved in cell wall biosynthesis